jgi:predicted short-subunit dehydrogenase-like oxidoreductase (DUF2520 family)
MNNYYSITIIGAGRVAWHVARHLETAGHHICEVWSPDGQSAKQLAKRLYEAAPTDRLNFEDSEAELFLLAVPDDAIRDVAEQLVLPEGTVLAHTSGSKGIQLLTDLPYVAGVFYPLQTFSKEKEVDFRQIPILIEGETSEATHLLTDIAGSLSKKVQYATSDQRKTLHLAAVFACNFTNHLLTIASNILETDELDFRLLHPLINETIQKALHLGPDQAQTGPAVRRDLGTLRAHLASLSDNPELAGIYRLLSESIMERKIQ